MGAIGGPETSALNYLPERNNPEAGHLSTQPLENESFVPTENEAAWFTVKKIITVAPAWN
jgi:hypothetical protein